MKRCEEEIIDFSGIAPHIDAPLRTYSTGMVARLAFAIATTIDAEIVLLDEVLAVGDASFRAKCEARYRELHAAGHTVLMVSHDPDIVRKFCDRAILLEGGRIIAEGRPPMIAEGYLSLLNGGNTNNMPLAVAL